jgi:hypothetical protein
VAKRRPAWVQALGKMARGRRRSPRMIAVAVLIAAFSAGISAAGAPSAAAKVAGRLTPSPRTTLPPNVKPVCAWPPPSGAAACLVLQRTDISAHAGPYGPDTTPAGYGPVDLHSAYSLPYTVGSGQGETVALVDAYDDPNAAADLGVYRAQYGLPPCTTANGCFKKVNQLGQTSGYPAPDANWAEEESLDIEMVSAICPSCHILLVEANGATFTDLAASVDTAVHLGANYVSNSYGASEASFESQYEKYYNHPGVAVTVASGDYGYGAEYPATFPEVVSVGGTSLLPASNARGWDEIVWTGTGSGCSSFYSKPSWQTDSGCVTRTDNDVSAVADPETGVAIYDSYGVGGWTVVGGTSVSSPIIASVYALAGQPAPGSNPASYVYSAHSALYDIISGTNKLSGPNCNPTYLCNGQPGYDGPSGWGTPNGLGAFAAPMRYVALGDSYSSGEGNPPYLAGSDTTTDKCHRSGGAYPELVKWPGQPLPISQMGGNDQFLFIACSGATTVGITVKAVDDPPSTFDANGNTDWGSIQSPLPEGLQADKAGNLTPSTTLATVGIGGNDARFADVLFGCLTTKGDCIDNNFYLKRHSNGATDPQPLNVFEPFVISKLLPQHLRFVHEQIHAKSPNAKIVVVGYPLLFPANTTTECKVGSIGPVSFYLNAQDQNWLNQMGTLLNSVTSSAVSYERSTNGIDIHFVDPTSTFSKHELCSPDPWILPLSGLVYTGGGLKLVDPGSFHPNLTGQQAYADLVNGCLEGTVPC